MTEAEYKCLTTRCPYCKGTDFEKVIQANRLFPYIRYHGTKKIEVYYCWSCCGGRYAEGEGAWWHFKIPSDEPWWESWCAKTSNK